MIQRINNMPMVPRICIQVGVLVAVSFAVLGASLIFIARSDSTQRVHELARTLARQEALEVSARLNDAAHTTRDLAISMETLAASSIANRQLANDMIINALKESPGIVSLWCVFERNAFDGKDSRFANSPYGNSVGRFAAGYDSADQGKIGLTQTNEAELVPGTGDYYFIPKNNRKDTLVDPYYYAYREGGNEVFETSFAVPIWKDGSIAGIAGADITLGALSSIIKDVKPYGKGYAVIISSSGTYAAHSRSTMLGKDIGNSREMKAVKAAVAAGREYEMTVYDKSVGGMARAVVVPVKVGNADAKWALAVYTPMKEALASVRQLTATCITISIGALVLVLFGVFTIARGVVRPIQRLRDVARHLADGSIDRATDLMEAS